MKKQIKKEEEVVVEKEPTAIESSQEIFPLKPTTQPQVEKPKVYLTDEEVREWQYIDTQNRVIGMQKQELADFEINITKTRKKAESLKEDIISNQSMFELAETKFKSKLQIKYGSFSIGENNEVIKVGD